MRSRTLPIILVALMLGCSSQQSTNFKDFQSFTSQLKPLETPLTFNSYKETKLNLLKIKDDAFINKIRLEYHGFEVYGKLFETNEFIAILGNIPSDIGSPIIITFDKKGNKIDSYLLYKTAEGDIGIYSGNYEVINKDMKINFTDSTITRKLNKEGTDELPGTDSLSVSKETYQIMSNGKIAKIK
jgi:hypothetical protein